jgi:hypothetical protein
VASSALSGTNEAERRKETGKIERQNERKEGGRNERQKDRKRATSSEMYK